MDSIATAMEGRSRLLVLDNCEHVLDAAADLIETIIEHSSTVRVLASREGIGVADEQLWPVPALDVTTGIDSEAATLFAERAQHVSPEITLSADDGAGAVVEICRRLDGIPLAIELAASRMQSMTVTEVRDRLGDRFRLLVGSRRGLERHQTLRHAVQWSYDLLDDAEKVLLNCCSVFAGGFDLASADVVTGADDEFATLDLLDALVRKSLLVADRSTERTRFSMLETIRQFAEEQLVDSGEADESALHTHVISRDEKLTYSPCGTVHDNGKPTSGSPSNSRISAPPSDGRPTTTISTRPRPSRYVQRYSDLGSNSLSPVRGRRKSLSRRARLSTGDWLSFTRWPTGATRPFVSTRESGTPRPVCSQSTADASTRCRLGSPST